jgi:hypothetical protein
MKPACILSGAHAWQLLDADQAQVGILSHILTAHGAAVVCVADTEVAWYLAEIHFTATQTRCITLPCNVSAHFLLQQTGHKLRVCIPDTGIICSGVLKAWLQTNSKTGAIQSVTRSQLSTAALLQQLRSQHAPYDPANPDGWVAVAHFSDGLSWLVDAAGLQQLVSS